MKTYCFILFSCFFLCVFTANGQGVKPNVDSTTYHHVKALDRYLNFNSKQRNQFFNIEHLRLMQLDSLQKQAKDLDGLQRKTRITDINAQYESSVQMLLTKQQFRIYQDSVSAKRKTIDAENIKQKRIVKPI